MADEKAGKEPERRRWQWVGADPDDTSEDARFRRRVAAVAREVMLAHGAGLDDVPPLHRTRATPVAPAAPVTPAAPVAPVAPGSQAVEPARGESGRGEPDPPNLPASTQPAAYFDIHSNTPYLITLAARAVLSAVEGSGSPTGVATTDLVLLTVARSPHGTGTKQLARSLELSPSTVSTSARRLVDHGWVKRRISPHDRRRSVLVATAAGREAAERVAASWRQTDRRLLDGLSVVERDELCRLLRRAAAALVS